MRSLEEHIASPTLGDPPAGGTVEGCAGGSCGVVARFFLQFDRDGRVSDATARVRGRASAFATASALCEQVLGCTLVDASRLGIHSLHPSFADLAQEDLERARVVEDAFHHALGAQVMACVRDGRAVVADGAGVDALVAMSGGVDSAVVLREAAEARDGGVVGVTLRLWIDPRAPDPEAACCSPESVRRARATCHAAGVGHIGIDLRQAFAAAVVAPFIGQYQSGETPNPCTRCNGHFRIDELVSIADAFAAADVVTGHYARRAPAGPGRSLIRRAIDERKDQSYMLCQLDPATVDRLCFPLGGRTKVEVRARAAELGLEQAEIPDSQEVCFLGGGDYRAFLRRAGALGPAGVIVSEDGDVLGSHGGIAAFTPGQRRGLGNLSGGSAEPRYVIDTDPSSGRVTVGTGRLLEATRVVLRDAVSHVDPAPERALVQVRYRAGGAHIGASVTWVGDGGAVLELDEPVRAPAPGQVACMYDDGGRVVGAGVITRQESPAAAVLPEDNLHESNTPRAGSLRADGN